jgi:hypothetical protein
MQFVLRTTLKQCENLTSPLIANKLNISIDETSEIIDELHREHVLRRKFTFRCPNCSEMYTVSEDKIGSIQDCGLCSGTINIREIIKGASVRFILDRQDFIEYIEENYKELLRNRNKEEALVTSKSTVILFDKAKEAVKSTDKIKLISGENNMKLFISHSSKDVEYVIAFVKFLEDIGMSNENVFCSSIKGYGIPWGKDIYDYLREEFNDNNLLVLFMLSKNYYDSVACLNEMGAAWIQKKEYRSILLPGFKFSEIEGAINANEIGLRFDDKDLKLDLNEVKKQLSDIFNLPQINENKWDRIRDEFIDDIDKLTANN